MAVVAIAVAITPTHTILYYSAKFLCVSIFRLPICLVVVFGRCLERTFVRSFVRSGIAVRGYYFDLKIRFLLRKTANIQTNRIDVEKAPTKALLQLFMSPLLALFYVLTSLVHSISTLSAHAYSFNLMLLPKFVQIVKLNTTMSCVSRSSTVFPLHSTSLFFLFLFYWSILKCIARY